MAEEKANRQIETQSYMNRMFCSTKERVSYIMYKAFGQTTLGKFDVGSDLWLYEMFRVKPTAVAKVKAALGIYDMVNDPVSAAIIDNMRTRWGKFKPFQYLSLLPSIILGIYICMLPMFAMGFDQGKKLVFYAVYLFANETVSAFFGGGGYIDNVFTPNPNERTSLLVSSKFVGDLLRKFPEQVAQIVVDIVNNTHKDDFVLQNKVLTKTLVTGKWIVWIISMVPTVIWYINSKERVAQSDRPPNPIKGFLSIFKNRPLLAYTLSDVIDGINVGKGDDLYYNSVLNFNSLTTVAGIPGSPISYASYGFVSKLRAKFSTKTLWFFCRGSTFFRMTLFFLVGLIGGKKSGMYLKKIPMTLAFMVGNCVEMCFYATSRVIGDEINFEVLDYCEWQNGYRVEATVNMMKGYFNKAKDIVLEIINAWLLERWAGFTVDEKVVEKGLSLDTKYRLFITAFGPKLIFDAICFIPMFFYNIDENTRKKMYSDLERMRSMRATMEKLKSDGEDIDTTTEA